MAKSNNQKGKILYLEKILLETGEDRLISMQEILTELMEYGINAERKSIYDDVIDRYNDMLIEAISI